MAETKTFYPLTITPDYSSRQPTESNSVGGRAVYQAMKGANNLKSDDNSIAYWGDRFPDKTHSQDPARYYPNTITSFSGSWNIGSPFSVSEWDIPKNIGGDAKVKKIVLQYAITHVQYKDQHVEGAGWSYNSEGCKFYVNEVRQTGANRVRAENGTVAEDSSNNYGIKLWFDGERYVSGQGLEYSQRTTQNLDEYPSMASYESILYNNSAGKLTINQLRKSLLRFYLPRNLNWDIGRIVMKYIRLVVTYEEIPPKFEIDVMSVIPNTVSTCPGHKSRIGVRIKSTNGHVGPVDVKLSGSGITNANIRNSTDPTNYRYNTWTAKTFEKDGTARFFFDAYYTEPGNYTITATVQNSSKNRGIFVHPCEPDFDFILLKDNKSTENNIEKHTPGGTYSLDNKIECYDSDNESGFFKIVFHKEAVTNDNESIIIDTDGLDIIWNEVETDNDITPIQTDTYVWTINNINHTKDIVLHGRCIFNKAGTYGVTGTYQNLTNPSYNKEKTYGITIKGVKDPEDTRFKKDYFKLRLEDGSDVRYNSLMFTKGDDLKTPLTYTTEDISTHKNDMLIIGEQKRIPVNEIQYITFDITLDSEEEIELNNVITYIEAVSDGARCDDIIIGSSKNAKLIDNQSDEKICIISSIKSGETTTIKLALQSHIAQECNIYLKPYNIKEPYTLLEDTEHQRKWTPAHVVFKDIPNIKIWVEGIHEINTSQNDKFSLYYHIQNLSDITGKNVRFQLKEPNSFKKIGYSLYSHTNIEDNLENGNNITSPWFNENNRIITFPTLSPQTIQEDYRLRVDYQATQKGIYDFIIKTLDNPTDLEDDQYENYSQHQLLVDIPSDIKVTTTISKAMPYVDELIDYHIHIRNNFKKQKKFIFNIYDIGRYEQTHTPNHYELQPHIICEHGTFTPSTDSTNMIGTWILEDIKADSEYDLTITLKPTQSGIHVIQSIFYDNDITDNNTQTFENKVHILERKKQIDFNVYQAVDENDIECCEEKDCKKLTSSDCGSLVQICDDDFINLNDTIFYVFDIVNNNRNAIENVIHVYARIPETFLTNGILCCSNNVVYSLNEENNLINFKINGLAGCKDKNNSKVKFCIKLQPSAIGNFISNFSLSTKSAKVLTKQLKLTVDKEFNERKVEHEINIYNFDKTNKYYRYEIDNNGEIFKFFNTGDKSVRLIDHEKHNESSIETYKGTNLRQLIKDIKNHSKYVDPVFLREGNNKLNDKGYELYPDGLIRRFGLLKSEVFHYSNQLPVTSNLVDRAMKWDIDKWDTKVWAGDIYDNGVFDLTIDYAKVPSNFNILDVNNPIKNLQNLVDNAKPYGTKAICYYSAVINLKIGMFIKQVNTLNNSYNHLKLNIPEKNIGTITECVKHDKSLDIYYNMFRMLLSPQLTNLTTHVNNIPYDENTEDMTLAPQITSIGTQVYSAVTNKKYTQDCYDIISNIYSTKEKNNNIDITKAYNPNDFVSDSSDRLVSQRIINFTNDLANKEIVGLKVEDSKDSVVYTYNPNFSDGILSIEDKNDILFVFTRDDMNAFYGFKIIVEDEVLESYNIMDEIDTVSMQVQLCTYKGHNVVHFWGSINDGDYYHIGHLLIHQITQPTTKLINEHTVESYKCSIDNPVVFKLSDRVNILRKDYDILQSMERKNKWHYLDNIQKKDKYAYFRNDIDIDKECDSENYKINVPKLILKYNNIDIDETDEILDINFKVNAQTNKTNFTDDININLFKDGDKFIPHDNIAKEIHYPSYITNETQEFLATIQLEQPNMTMCSECMQTSLGYYEECQHCGSTSVYHANEKMAATVCHNCGYIVKGWHDHCTHCLSYDIDRVKIDYNKTYCNKCHNIADDYYSHCPYCFSSDIIHLTNHKQTYKIFDKSRQNIEPIDVNINDKKVNIFNLDIPFSSKTKEIDKDTLSYLNLAIYGHNNNSGEYYYCESCNKGGIGHYEICPHCNSKLIHNERLSNCTLDVFYQDNNGLQQVSNNTIVSPDFTTQIDLQELGLNNPYDEFSLLFYVENQSYDEIAKIIMSLPIDDESQGDIIEELMKIRVTIDNLSLDYKYKNQKEWIGVDNLYNKDHTGIRYHVPYNKRATDDIAFNDFNIPHQKYTHAYLYLHGITKNSKKYKINFSITNDNKIYHYSTESIYDDIFNYQVDLMPIIGENIKNLGVKVFFSECDPDSDVTILNCDVLTEYKQIKNILHDDINEIDTKVIEKSNYYLLSSANNDVWGLNNTKPYYLTGRQLKTNLIGYIDFGTLNLEEYIRLYDIEMIILYKNKMGQIITDNIPVYKKQSSDTLNEHAIISKDNYYPEQSIGGDMLQINGEAWLSFKYPREILNNLEYDVSNINNDDELLNSIPLYNKIAQSFILDATEISRLSIQYYKNRGYPNDIINVYICKDDNDKPGTIISSNKVKVNIASDIINVDINAHDLTYKGKYWLVIEDNNTNEYNYHQFAYNTNTEIGQLIRYEDNEMIYDTNCALSFSIDGNVNIMDVYTLPTFWSIYHDDKGIEYDAYKICMTLYRYNIQSDSNISASNLHINYGYQIE